MLFFDSTYILIIIALIISLAVQGYMKSTFSKYSEVRSASGLTGARAAERILQSAGLSYVKITYTRGELTDHYDPETKSLALSEQVYHATSLAAIGVAAHECGHAIQDATGYGPLRTRASLVPIANIGSALSWPLFFIGLISSFKPLILAGIIFFCAALLFQIVTLPVEFNASSRALSLLKSTGILSAQEIEGSGKVLRAAAMTYVAAVAASALQLLRLILLARRNSRD
mgnify:CR=1 FL=1